MEKLGLLADLIEVVFYSAVIAFKIGRASCRERV